MTDIKDRFAGLLASEPTAPSDLDGIITSGRKALRRRQTLTAVAGSAGTAAITAAVVVPIVTTQGGATGASVVAATSPSPPAHQKCYFELAKRGSNAKIASLGKQLRITTRGKFEHVVRVSIVHRGDKVIVEYCTGTPGSPATTPPAATPAATPSAPAVPRYHYHASPQKVADGLAAQLAEDVGNDNLTIVYSRPFAQESSTIEKGHPSYYGGNVDVSLAGGNQGDIGVQVTHRLTTQVPFDGACKPAHCVETTLPDGSVLRTDQVDPGGGGLIVTAEVHRPDGVVVAAQESNYGFGPSAPVRQYGDQPLSLTQLVALAEDPAFTF